MLSTSSDTGNLKDTPTTWSLTSALLFIITTTWPTGATITFTPASPATQAETCPQKPNLTPQYWQENDFDGYIRNYPMGTSLTLPEYVQHLATPVPFDCGVGKLCTVPPICHPLCGPDWYVLYATSQWNFYANSLVNAMESSSRLAQVIVPQLLKDFIKDYTPATSHGAITKVDLTRILVSTIEPGGVETRSIPNSETSNQKESFEPITVKDSPRITFTNGLGGQDGSDVNRATKRPPENNNNDEQDEPEKWKYGRHLRFKRQLPNTIEADLPSPASNCTYSVEETLAQLKQEFQRMRIDSLTEKINTPISLDTGVYSSLRGGRFLVEHIKPAGLGKKAEKMVLLIGISAVLKYQNVILLVRKSSCHKQQEYISPTDTLSFCASDGTIFEFVQVSGNILKKEIYNAHLIKDKYGFSESLLTSQAWRCFQKSNASSKSRYIAFDEDDQMDSCLFKLPVCDLTDSSHSTAEENLAQTCKTLGLLM